MYKRRCLSRYVPTIADTFCAGTKPTPGSVFAPDRIISDLSKIQLVVYYQCCVLIGGATTRLYVIAH